MYMYSYSATCTCTCTMYVCNVHCVHIHVQCTYTCTITCTICLFVVRVGGYSLNYPISRTNTCDSDGWPCLPQCTRYVVKKQVHFLMCACADVHMYTLCHLGYMYTTRSGTGTWYRGNTSTTVWTRHSSCQGKCCSSQCLCVSCTV